MFVSLLALLVWVPMPFGSASDPSQPWLILPPLIVCAGAALLRAGGSRSLLQTRPARFWTAGAVLFAAVIALQLIPLPPSLLTLFSQRSAEIWQSATRVAALGGSDVSSWHPLTIDPDHTSLQLFRVLAYFATFLASMILVRNKARTLVLAVVLAGMGVFEAVYAWREAALGRYAIWGWKNTLIFGRATGTFVNPNHFAHYAAIVLPMALFLSLYAWHGAAPAGATFRRRLVKLIDKQIILFVCGLLAAFGCITAVLISESRGATLAIIGGFAIVGALATDKGKGLLRGGLFAVGASSAILITVVVLGHTETVNRFEGTSSSQLDSRRASVAGAFRIWKMFPLLGSGAGTYEDVVLMTRATSSDVLANHAHDDYAEILATTGTLGFLVSVLPLLAGFVTLTINAFGKRGEPMSWRRRAFKGAALTSIAIAMIHALVDFNFFIPANPITLAAIAGAAVAPRES